MKYYLYNFSTTHVTLGFVLAVHDSNLLHFQFPADHISDNSISVSVSVHYSCYMSTNCIVHEGSLVYQKQQSKSDRTQDSQ
jgi:hypothetical protein